MSGLRFAGQKWINSWVFGALFLFGISSGLRGQAAGKAAGPVGGSRLRTLNDTDFFFVPPQSGEQWAKRSAHLREQLNVSLGLYPKPGFVPLKPVVREVADRPEYSVHAVHFESVPGLLVTGSLYLPKGKEAVKDGKRPGVLCPHGHWQNGRFYENSEAAAKKEIASGAESTMEGALYPLQARCANLAMLGAVVFHYDMVGYADNGPIPHRDGFQDPGAALHLQGQTQLQTLNSLRALDFLHSMNQVDPKRIGVTGASGGGTQTFLLGALDERPAVAFPAVMVGSRMQGGCNCENAPYLRVGTGNVEIAGLFYPRPLAMSGANDWTIAIEKEGLPELKKLYALGGVDNLVQAKCWPEFGHNYNQKSREYMYGWMVSHLGLAGEVPVREKSFKPVLPAALAVFDKEHPRPESALSAAALRARLEKEEEEWIRSNRAAGAQAWKKAVGPFARTVFDLESIRPEAIQVRELGQGESISDFACQKLEITHSGTDRKLICDRLEPKSGCKGTVVWVGKSKDPEVVGLLNEGWRVVVPGSSYQRGGDAWKKAFTRGNAPYTYCYNRPALAESVRDLALVVKGLRFTEGMPVMAGNTLAAVAGCQLGESVKAVVADLNHFNYTQHASVDWGKDGELEWFLPGALRFGGLPGLLSSNPPSRLVFFGVEGTGAGDWSELLKSGDGMPELIGGNPKGPAEMVAQITSARR